MVRFYLLSTHYRSPIEWNEDRLREAGIAYDRLREALAKSESFGGAGGVAGGANVDGDTELRRSLAARCPRSAVSSRSRSKTTSTRPRRRDTSSRWPRRSTAPPSRPTVRVPAHAAVIEAGRALRRLRRDDRPLLGRRKVEEEVPDEVQSLVQQRDEARLQKLWSRADELRDEILARGYVLEDSKGGTRARRKP